MIRIALTGKQLAELYVLNTMGVPTGYQDLVEDDSVSPEQYSFLIDTNQGREVLLMYAEKLADRINDVNSGNIEGYFDEYRFDQYREDIGTAEENKPEQSEIYSKALAFLVEQLQTAKLPPMFTSKLIPVSPYAPNLQETIPFLKEAHQLDLGPIPRNYNNNDREKFLERRINPNSSEVLGEAIEKFAKSVDVLISPYDSINYRSDHYNWDQIILEMWDQCFEGNEELAGSVDDFQSDLASLARNKTFQDAFWEYYFKENPEEFEKDDDGPENEAIWDEVYDPDSAHFQIDDAIKELYLAIKQARTSQKREDYWLVMAGIDKLSSLSHEGGPAFEYGDTTIDTSQEPNLIEIMNRKFGDHFLAYVLSHNLLPEKYLEPLQSWYDERTDKEAYDAYIKSQTGDTPVERERNLSNDEYYKHPYYSQREQWIEENSPTFQQWTPHSPEYENRANIESIENLIGEKTADRWGVMRDFVDEQRQWIDEDDIPFAGKRKRLSVASRLLSLSSQIDGFAPDLSDRIEKILIGRKNGTNLII